MLMKDYSNSRKSKLLLLTLFALLIGASPTWAQKELPYSYDFSTALATEGWTTESCHNYTGISSGAFRFYYNSTPPQYLISPMLETINSTVDVSFQYKAENSTWAESFQVGYSTAEDINTASFTWDTEITVTNTTYSDYKTTFPAGVKYVAIRYNSNDKYYLYIDNFKVSKTPTCFTPTNLTTADITSNSVQLSWTSDAEAFNVQYKKATDISWTDISGTVTSPYTIESLSPATSYQVRVRTYCDATDQSDWTDAVSFTTDCATLTIDANNSFSEDFSGSGIPTCWGTIDSGSYKWSISSNRASTGYYGPIYLILPPMELSVNSLLTFDNYFNYANDYNGNTNKSSIVLSTTGTAAENFSTTLYTFTKDELPSSFSTSLPKEISLAAYTGQTVYIAFKHEASNGHSWAVDNVVVKEAPACIKPTDLAASNPTAEGATLSWTAGGDEADWQISYSKTEAFDPTTDGTIVDVNTNPYTLTGLDKETTYYVAIRSKKGDDTSDWTDKISFTTTATCITPTGLAANNVGLNSATLTWTDETTQSKWEISYSTTSGNPDNGTIVEVTEKTCTIENLTPGTTYYASVRAVNSETDKSAWSTEISFTPGVLTVNNGTTTNAYIPIYGNYANYLTKSQVIIPAETLSAIANSRINKLVFYNNQNSRTWGGAKFDVYLTEVDKTTFSTATLESWDGMDKVYSGSLTVSDKQMVIEFTDPYDYQGGNLLIGVNQTTQGSSEGIGWYGVDGVYNGVGGYGSSLSRQSFLPKMSVYYTAIPIAPRMVVDTTPISFGLVEANSTQTATFTIENKKGTATLEGINVTCTDGVFSVSEVKDASIAVGGNAITVTVTFDTTTPGSYNGTITVSASDQGNATINVNGTVKDPEKVYESGFTALPTDWTTDGTWNYSEANGAYTTAWYIDSGTLARLKTPKLTISEGETFIVEAKGYSTSNTNYQHLVIQYSSDGTTWTTFGNEASLDPSNWKAFTFTGAPAGEYYIAILASQADIRMFYGGELPHEPKMVVTQPASLDYGIISEATAKTFTITNTGKAELKGINVASSNAAFTISGAPSTLAAGASAEVTITMLAATAGVLSSDITVSATDMENVKFTVNGVVLPEGMPIEDFSGTTIPANWTSSGAWTFTTEGIASGKASTAYMMTPKLTFTEGDFLVIRMAPNDNYSGDYLEIEGSSNNGSTYGAYYKKITVPKGKDVYANYIVSDIPTSINKIRFAGYFVDIDEIYGLTYAPELKVTDKEEFVVASGLTYDFGECAADATVTYNFANIGSGSINITNVAITGDGAAAYSTNWTESVAAPFALTITRAYDGERTEAQEAVVTVTTSDGNFVINVTGIDKAANAPELAVSTNAIDFGKVTEDAVETVTVSNNGTGVMTVDIASDSEDFEVSTAKLTEIGAGESKTFDITFKFSTPYGVKNGKVTVTPTYDTYAAQEITVTGKAKDPDVWSEDFSGNELPIGWSMEDNWTIANGMAKSTYSHNSSYYLTTPPLTVSSPTDELTFDYVTTGGNVNIIVEKSKDGGAWETCTTTPALNTYMSNGTSGTATITGLEAGTYQFRFQDDDYNLDNFEGFKLNLPDHMASITGYTIPASSSYTVTMKEGQSFEATVTVKEMRGVAEELTAKLYMGETVIGTQTGSVAANGTETLTITATPNVAAPEGVQMHIEVEWAGTTMTTEAVTRYVAAITNLTLDETSSDAITAGTYDNVTLKRTFIAGWNTVCLPFTISDAIEIFGEGTKVYEFNSYTDDGTLGFKTTTTLTASYPYIVYTSTEITGDLLWNNITIASNDVDAWYTRKTDSSNNAAYFRGTYAPIAAPNMEGKWGVTSEARIAKGTNEAWMKGFRAYFELPEGANGARLSFYDDATGITTVIGADELNDDKAYNLGGQRVQNPKKGLYIINGKKVVIK